MRKQLVLHIASRCPFHPSTALCRLLRQSCEAALADEKPDGLYEADLTFVDDGQIQILNRDNRHIDAATDVLSFPLGEENTWEENPASARLMLGDIIISYEHALNQATDFGHSKEREFCYLAVHSMLHLLGYDHMTDPEREIMRQKEEAALAKIGLAR